MRKKIIASSMLAALLLSGCGSTSTGNSADGTGNGEDPEYGVGYYVDSAVVGAHYKCGDKEGTTEAGGKFLYPKGVDCTFSVANIPLRKVPADALKGDNVTIQETNTTVVQFLLTLDKDGNKSNGVTIDPAVVKALQEEVEQQQEKIAKLMRETTKLKELLRKKAAKVYHGKAATKEEALEHIVETAAKQQVAKKEDEPATSGSSNQINGDFDHALSTFQDILDGQGEISEVFKELIEKFNDENRKVLHKAFDNLGFVLEDNNATQLTSEKRNSCITDKTVINHKTGEHSGTISFHNCDIGVAHLSGSMTIDQEPGRFFIKTNLKDIELSDGDLKIVINSAELSSNDSNDGSGGESDRNIKSTHKHHFSTFMGNISGYVQKGDTKLLILNDFTYALINKYVWEETVTAVDRWWHEQKYFSFRADGIIGDDDGLFRVQTDTPLLSETVGNKIKGEAEAKHQSTTEGTMLLIGANNQKAKIQFSEREFTITTPNGETKTVKYEDLGANYKHQNNGNNNNNQNNNQNQNQNQGQNITKEQVEQAIVGKTLYRSEKKCADGTFDTRILTYYSNGTMEFKQGTTRMDMNYIVVDNIIRAGIGEQTDDAVISEITDSYIKLSKGGSGTHNYYYSEDDAKAHADLTPECRNE